MMNKFRLTRDGVSFLVHRGESSETPIVLLHGVFDSAACWDGLVGELDTGREVFALDARAHGHTPLPNDDFTLQRLGVDAASFIEGLGRPVILVGHSMGGITAQQVAVTRPELVESLVLEDPAWVAAESTPVGETPDIVSVRAAQLATWSPERVLQQGRLDHPLWHEDEFLSWHEAKRDVDLAFVDARQDWTASAGTDRMADVSAPTLLLIGDPARGALVTHETAERVRRLMGDRLDIVHLRDAGHDIRKDQREGTATALSLWLARH